MFRYLERFHEAGEESSREAHRAFIPSPNEALGVCLSPNPPKEGVGSVS